MKPNKQSTLRDNYYFHQLIQKIFILYYANEDGCEIDGDADDL